MHSPLRRLVSLAFVAVLALSPVALFASDEHHDDHGVAIADVPADAQAALKHAAEHGTITHIAKHEEHGHVTYKATIHQADGTNVEVTVDEHGKVQHDEKHGEHHEEHAQH